MQKLLSVLLALALLAAPLSGLAEEEFIIEDDGAEASTLVEFTPPEGIQRDTVVRVGTDTPFSGYFATDMWGNNASDMDIRSLLHGYETVVWTDDMGMMVNETVIANMEREVTGDSHVFTIDIVPGLSYNDGTPITAKDYILALLLGGPELSALGAASQGYGHIQGYSEYQQGIKNEITGVRLLSDTRFSVSVRGDHMPYYYDLASISMRPYPLHVIAPGCDIVDDGQGVYIKGDFTAEILQETLLNPETGYVFNPRVTCGPYALESFDLKENTASFIVNEKFIGDPTGAKPYIERIVFQHVPEDEVIERLQNGEIDIQARVQDGGVIQQAQAAIGKGEETWQTVSYPRTGFAFLAFACEMEPTSSQAVRRAMAMSLDREALLSENKAGTAMRVYGYYGLGQWMVAYGDDDFVAMEHLPELDIPLDPTGAVTLLEADGWTLNEKGEPYQPGDGTRHKDVGGTLVPLVIQWAVTQDDSNAENVRVQFEKTLPEVGIDLEITELPFSELLRHYYRQDERTYNMFSLASNFTYIFDPYYDFNTDPIYQGQVNTSGLRSDTLMAAAQQLQRTEPGDQRTYVERWLAFQQSFVELSPMIPLYSNVYFDILVEGIEGYDATGNTGWATGILSTYVVEVAEEEEAEEVEIGETGDVAEIAEDGGKDAKPEGGAPARTLKDSMGDS